MGFVMEIKKRGCILFALLFLPIASNNASEYTQTWETRGMPYTAFDTLPAIHISVGKATLDIAFVPGKLDLPQATILNWIAVRARIVADYYGNFPVKRLRLLIIPSEGTGIRHGTSFGYGGAAIKIQLGGNASQAELDNDWILAHEMVHLAFPSQEAAHL